MSQYVKTYLKLFEIFWNGSNRFKHVQISLTFSLFLKEGQISEAETLKFKLEQTQREYRLAMEESGTKHTPNWFVKKDDKSPLSIIFIVFFDKPIWSMFSVRFFNF